MLWQQKKILSYLNSNSELKYEKLSVIDNILKKEFYDQELLNESYNNMIDWAIAGYVWGINDPYTVYLTKDENIELTNELQDNAWFAGIWAVIEKQGNYALISSVLKNSPAAQAWLLPLDRIYMVEDKELGDLSASEIVQLTRWEKWTVVNLFIYRPGKDWEDDVRFWIPITRDDLNIPSVTSEVIQIDDKNIIYLEISIISNRTTSLLLNEIMEVSNKIWKIDGIILDLRGNSWWYLDEAVKILWHFFPKGTLLINSKYNQLYQDINMESEWKWELWNYPIVLLVDQLTASAWEIIALTFQEHWSKVIWMKTFWKWSIQSVEYFNDWSSLKYTIWKRFSSNGINIDKVWITPDIEVKWDYDQYKENWIDNQLEIAKQELLKEINL